jgi:hypothetical protein
MAHAARPDAASDCVQSLRQISGLKVDARRLSACQTGFQPQVRLQGRPVIDPAAALKQGLIW